MSAPDIAAIAKGLTKAQREALSCAREEHVGLFRTYHRGVTRKAIRERGLAHGDYAYLTPLGLAVRAYLMEHGDA